MAVGFVVYGAKGSGSVPVEATLTLLGLPYTVVEGASWSDKAAFERLQAVNPLGQVPALVLPDGQLMTESAAILVWLADSHPASRLSPAPEDARRAQFLRWMTYVPAAIYSLFWVRDEPSRLAADKAHEEVIKERTRERIAECWRIMGEQLTPAGAYTLGDEMTVLDLYLACVSRWTPGRRRIYREAPALAAVLRRLDADPRLAAFWAERMPFTKGWEGT